MKILVTGAAGFIGFSVVKNLIQETDYEIVALDNINDYYDVNLKYERLAQLGFTNRDIEYNDFLVSDISPKLRFVKLRLEDKENIFKLFETEKFDKVCHLAAQAGVRYSIENPYAYIESNINGFLNILEACRNYPVKNLVYASSSSVYGLNEKTPFSEDDKTDTPVSLYAATKKSNELMAHTYSHLYKIPLTGLRFFTVYGPLGRPDMAPFLFTDAIINDRPIKIFNNGDMLRDFTYVDDIVRGVLSVLYQNPSDKSSLYRIFNIGNSTPVKLMDFIHELELAIGKEANKVFMPMQPGDVYQTYADSSKLEKEVDFKPSTSLKDGIESFVSWYKSFYSK